MYRIALILGLLVTPAAAETYTARECATVEWYFRYCAKSLDENDGECMLADVGYKWLRWGRYGTSAIKQRHRLPDDVFDGLCKKVCYEEMTAQQALKKFCRRPAPAGYVDSNIGEALCAMTERNGSRLCARAKP
jgi:hypothetical protein